MSPQKLDKARDLIHQLHATGKYPAIQVCIRHRGEIVLHETLGESTPVESPNERRQATSDTRFMLFSISKAITAVALHILVDRGELPIDDRVHWYIPEFAKHGKDNITLRHLLTHTAGIPMLFWRLGSKLAVFCYRLSAGSGKC